MSNFFQQTARIPGTDLVVPYGTVGVMMFGKRADEAESLRIVNAALELGLNFFDTANMYQDGESERILGKALQGRREECVIATKVGYGKNADGAHEGLSAAAIRTAIEASLERLGTDHVDIYYFHRPDYEAPATESLATVAELIGEGKVRHLGLSNYAAWQTLEVLNLCEANGWPKPVITQMIYNPLVRQIEHEYTSMVERFGLYLTVYNPLAGGLLTGKYASLAEEAKGGRFVGNEMYRKRYWSERFIEGALGLKAVADAAGISVTHLALRWIARQDAVRNILLGPSNADQLRDCLQAGDAQLTDEVAAQVDACLLQFNGTDATYAR